MSFLQLLIAGRRDGGVINMDNVKWEAFGFQNPTDFLAAVERGVERGHLERDGDHLLKLTVRGDATAALSPLRADGLPPVGVRPALLPPSLPPSLPPAMPHRPAMTETWGSPELPLPGMPAAIERKITAGDPIANTQLGEYTPTEYKSPEYKPTEPTEYKSPEYKPTEHKPHRSHKPSRK